MKQTAVEFLAEKYNYITWLRNRDEISAGTADEWRKKFLEESKEMEKQQMIDFTNSFYNECVSPAGGLLESPEEYYDYINTNEK